jgi:hypothetical protein
VEGAQIAHKLFFKIGERPHITFRTKNRMSVALPVPGVMAGNTSALSETGRRSRGGSKVLEQICRISDKIFS